MELRHIRYFLVLAEELNFSRAAERLHIAQPPLSRQIAELEEELEVRLFYRTKRHVELTQAGKVFLKKANQILDQVDQACISTRLSSLGKEGELRIGFTGTVQDLIPGLRQYRELYPQVGIILHQMNSTAQIEALQDHKIDVGLIAIPLHSNKIEVRPMKETHFMAALPEKHPLAIKSPLYLSDMADETFIITPKSAGALYYEMVMGVFQNADFTPNIAVQASDLQTVLALVAGGMGVALTPTSTNPYSGVVKRKVEDMDLTIQVSLAWRKDNRSEILDKFLKFAYELDLEWEEQIHAALV